MFTVFAVGDFLLTVLHGNVRIMCGDGAYTKNCALNARFVQLVPPNNPFFITKISTNSLKVQGLTCLVYGNLVTGLPSATVALGTPRDNMVFDNFCI